MENLTQVFLPYIRTLPKDEIKVLIGDNLAAHLSPVVLAQCEENNVRYHTVQPYSTTVPYMPLPIQDRSGQEKGKSRYWYLVGL
jgi:hypothetical protein